MFPTKSSVVPESVLWRVIAVINLDNSFSFSSRIVLYFPFSLSNPNSLRNSFAPLLLPVMPGTRIFEEYSKTLSIGLVAGYNNSPFFTCIFDSFIIFVYVLPKFFSSISPTIPTIAKYARSLFCSSSSFAKR